MAAFPLFWLVDSLHRNLGCSWGGLRTAWLPAAICMWFRALETFWICFHSSFWRPEVGHQVWEIWNAGLIFLPVFRFCPREPSRKRGRMGRACACWPAPCCLCVAAVFRLGCCMKSYACHFRPKLCLLIEVKRMRWEGPKILKGPSPTQLPQRPQRLQIYLVCRHELLNVQRTRA